VTQSGAARSAPPSEPPQHRAHAVERAVDRIEVGRGDVAAGPRDPQRRRERARGSGGAAEQVGAVEPRPLPPLADVERDALGGPADLVGERLALLPQPRLEGASCSSTTSDNSNASNAI
jgi:hypothetical protein